MTQDRVEWGSQAASLAATVGLAVAVLYWNVSVLPPALEASKPTPVALSVIEEPPLPAAVPPPAPEPPPPPQPVAVPSVLPPPPPTRPRHIVRPQQKPVLQPMLREAPPPVAQPQAEAMQRPMQQTLENHSAEGAYIARLHAIVQRNTRPPDSAAYRLSHASGEVLVGFILSRGGAVSAVHVLRSSGHPAIDEQGSLIVAGGHYLAMPQDVFPGQASHAFQIPVSIVSIAGERDSL